MEAVVHRLRLEALDDLWSGEHRNTNMARLAEVSGYGFLLGELLASDPYRDEAAKWLLEVAGDHESWSILVLRGLASKMIAHGDGDEWLAAFLARIEAARGPHYTALVAAGLPPSQQLWESLAAVDEGCVKPYWKNVRFLASLESEVEWHHAIRKLIEVERFVFAVESASNADDKLSSELTLEVLGALRDALKNDDTRQLVASSTMTAYYIEQLFLRLDAGPDVDVNEVAALELAL